MAIKSLNWFLIVSILSITFSNCKRDESKNPAGVLPTLTTTAVTSITNTSALSGGNISSDGGETVTARGVCWGTTANPVITGSHSDNGSGTGSYSSIISGLTANTTYYVRAYATNSVGTAYGNEILFTTGTGASRLKKIIASYDTKKADIVFLEYDANNRLTKFSEWTEDSTFTPIKITGANYATFTYPGTSNIPLKSSFTHEPGNTVFDSTLYYYDLMNRVTREDCYKNNQIIGRNDYTYLSTTKVIRENYYTSGGPLILGRRDSMTFDAQNRIVESQNTLAASTDKDVYTYDTKVNPYASINVFTYVYTLHVDDRKFYFRAPNNLAGYTNSVGTSALSIQSNYAYDLNLLPLSGTSALTAGSTLRNYSLKFEYY